jgi:ATP phosphoribosyltransferase
LVVAAREDSGISSIEQIPHAARVATAFPSISQSYFQRVGRSVKIVPVSGAAEIAPHLGIAEIVVDLTSSGSTLRMNGLREVATILESTARLITARGSTPNPGPSSAPAKSQALSELATALGSVIRARDKRYLMANVPRAKLEQVRHVLPGLKGPTVVDILDGGSYVAVHAVVAANSVYRVISALKGLGCEGILVTRIERLMP